MKVRPMQPRAGTRQFARTTMSQTASDLSQTPVTKATVQRGLPLQLAVNLSFWNAGTRVA